MKYLRKNYSVLFSPRFHGLVATLLLAYLQAKGIIGGIEVKYLTYLVGSATSVGVLDSIARKSGGK